MNFKSKLPQVTTSIFSVMSSLAKEYDAINLSQGFPDFNSDPKLINLVNQNMKDGHNQYAPMQGDFALRERISEKINALYGRKYNPHTEITITAGATQAIFTAIAATINKGDEVLIFTPAYDCYEPTIKLFGGIPISIQLQAPDFKIDWEQVSKYISNKTKLIIINSPHNPTGTVLNENDLLALSKIVSKNNVFILSDEVYEHIIYDGQKHQSVALNKILASRSFIVASFGKTFHNTGWKVGYCVAPKELTAAFQQIHQYLVFSVNHPVQKALAEYLENPENYTSLSSFYQQKRDLFLTLLQDSRFTIIPSKGTYFQLLDYSEISSLSDIKFAEYLTKKHNVATIPISVFSKNKEDNKMIRVCFAKKEKTLIEAATILRNL